MEVMLSEVEAQQRAVEAASSLLVSAHTLTKVAEKKESCEKQKGAIESQLSTISQAQIEEAKMALELINHAFSYMNTLSTELTAMDNLMQGSQKLIDNYQLIRSVHFAKRNINTTRSWLRRLLNLEEEVAELEEMLEDDSFLLQVHDRVRELEKLRDSVIASASDHPEYIPVFDKYFAKINQISQRLADQIWERIEDALYLAEREPSILIRCLRIIEREEADDAMAWSGDEDGGGPAPPGRRTNATIKGYFGECLEHLKIMIDKRFEEKLEEGKESVDQTLNCMLSFLDDMRTVQYDLVPCFPKRYSIFHFFFREYQLRINKKIQEYLRNTDELSNKDKLDIISWIDEYHLELDSYAEDEEASIMNLQDTQATLIANYCNDIGELMDGWIGNLVEAEFATEAEDVEPNREGKVSTQGPVDLFKMVEQQFSIVRIHPRTELVLSVIRTCIRTLKRFQELSIEKLSTRWRELPFEFICAVLNNCNACMDYTVSFGDGVRSALGNLGLEEDDMDALLSQTENGFIDVAKRATIALVDHMFQCLDTVFSVELFDKPWHESAPTMVVIVSIEDYFEDLTIYLHEQWFSKVGRECLDRWVSRYLEALIMRKHEQLQASCQTLMDSEVDEICKFFSLHVREVLVNAAVEPVRAIARMIGATTAVDYHLAAVDMIRRFPDATQMVGEAVVQFRSDLERKVRNEMLQTWAKIYEGQHMDGQSAKAEDQVLGTVLSRAGKKEEPVKENKEKSGLFSRNRKSKSVVEEIHTPAPASGGNDQVPDGVEVLSLDDLLG